MLASLPISSNTVDNDRKNISRRLRECRLAAKLSQTDVARDFLISRQSVSGWERGEGLPTVLQLYEIGLLYGVSTDYILYGMLTMPRSAYPIVSEIFRTRTPRP